MINKKFHLHKLSDTLHNEGSATPVVFPSFSWPCALAVMFVLTLLMFGDVLLSGGDRILSSPHTDIASQFLYWRDFGFRELRNGNLALWNPHLFSGAPFFGGFQSALLYPLNFPYLLLPVGAAINIGIALHVLLLGFFTFLWARNRGLHPLAALLSGILIMFCGPHFLHIYAGHLPNLCTMIWVPLIFLSVDRLLERPTLGWGLLGSFAVSMQVLAGHPQYVYYTALSALIYTVISILCACRLGNAPRPDKAHLDMNKPRKNGHNYTTQKNKELFFSLGAKKWALPAVLAIFAAGAALSAVQILAGLDAARESVRASGVPLSFAAMFSFPPENFLTLIAPYFFGDLINNPYWGRAYLWEMNLFIGINGLLLAGFGFLRGGRTARTMAAVIVVLFILALGVHTPLFAILYDYLPGFDKFRGTSKFIFFATLLMIILAGTGLDKLMRRPARKDAAATPPKPSANASLDTPTDTTTEPLTHTAINPPAATSTRPPTVNGKGKTLLNRRKHSLVAGIIPKTFPGKDGSLRGLRINLPLSWQGYVFILAAALLTAAFALWLNLIGTESLSPEIWSNFLAMIARSRESYLDARLFAHREFILHTAFFASQWLLIAALTLAVTAWLWRLTRKQHKMAVYGIVLLTLLEVFLFARLTRETFNPTALTVPGLEAFARSIKEDERILNLWQPNSALSLGTHDIWGYDPGVLLRYAQFIGFTQGYNPEKVTNYVNFKENHRLLKMLRLRFIFVPEGHQIKILENRDLLPRLNLIENWEVIPQKTAVLKRMGEESFDPNRTVILEKEPELGNSGGPRVGAKQRTWEASKAGNCRIIDESTDHMTILAQLPYDAILLITDTYSQGWGITPLNEAGQQSYDILPGNYTLMAVPLKRGEHQLRLEYAPRGYSVGKWISVTALLFYILVVACFSYRSIMARRNP